MHPALQNPEIIVRDLLRPKEPTPSIGALHRNSEHLFFNVVIPHLHSGCFIICSTRTDPLVGHGRHFGRTIRTFCRVHTLITNGLSRAMQLELGRVTEEDFSRRFVTRTLCRVEEDSNILTTYTRLVTLRNSASMAAS